jgi:hypothetical protein
MGRAYAGIESGYGNNHAGRRNVMNNYKKVLSGLIGVWFSFALVAGARHAFENNDNRIGVAVAAAASAPILLFALWFGVSERLRVKDR